MDIEAEIFEVLQRHLLSIRHNDIEAYHETTGEDLTLYEWWVTPHRIDGLPFHDFMMTENARRKSFFSADLDEALNGTPVEGRMDFANLKIQQYGDAAIANYTLLVSTSTSRGVSVAAHNESRVLIRSEGKWKVVHVHKSPAWPAPYSAPQFATLK